jgi:protein SCO1
VKPLARSRRSAMRLGLAFAGLTLAATLLVGCGGSASTTVSANGGGVMHISGSSGPSQSDSHYPGAIVVPAAAAKPTVTLTDTSDQPYNLARATRGRVTIVYFGYTHCPDVCPINMALAGASVSRLPTKIGDQITVVFITTDPRRDTPKVIRAWLDNFSGGDRFVGLTGTIAKIHEAEKQVGMPLSFVESGTAGGKTGYQIEHAGYLLAYSQDNLAHLQFYDNEPAPSFATSLSNLVTHGFQP